MFVWLFRWLFLSLSLLKFLRSVDEYRAELMTLVDSSADTQMIRFRTGNEPGLKVVDTKTREPCVFVVVVFFFPHLQRFLRIVSVFGTHTRTSNPHTLSLFRHNNSSGCIKHIVL
jgi:hypothetical protein